jgi:hypothetical protein
MDGEREVLLGLIVCHGRGRLVEDDRMVRVTERLEISSSLFRARQDAQTAG